MSRALRRYGPAAFPAALLLLVSCGERELSAAEVLDRMLEAIDTRGSGGAVQSLSTTAEGSGPLGLFATTVTSIPPDSLYFRYSSGAGTTEIWSTPKHTWGGRAGEKYEPLGPDVRDFVRRHEFHLMLLHVRERFSGFAVTGAENVSGEECLRLTMTSEAGDDASLCVATDDWLPVELTLAPSTSGPLRIAFDDWAVVDGLRVFRSLALFEDTDDVYSWTFVDISVNRFAAEIRVPPPTLPRVREGDE